MERVTKSAKFTKSFFLFFYINIGYTIGHNMPDITGAGK